MTYTKPSPAKPTLVLFDLDGTLIDSLDDIHESLTHCLTELGRIPVEKSAMRAMVGDGAAMLIDRALAATTGAPVDRSYALSRFMDHYRRGGTTGTRLYPGCQALLSRLKSAGLTLGLCTNKPIEPTRRILDHFALTRFFAVIVGGDSLAMRKPDPGPLFYCADTLGIARPQTILIGDSEVDAAASAAADMRFIFMTYGYHRGGIAAYPIHATCDRLADIAPYLGL